MKAIEAQAELSVIRKIMEDSRRLNIDNGVHYIFWGIIVAIGLLTNYFLIISKAPGQYMGLSWLVLMVIGVIVDVIIARRQIKNEQAATFAGKLLSSLWLASGISMFIFGFVGAASNAYNPVFICPIISTSLGISYFTSGAIQQVKWLQNVAYGWWTGGILLFIFPSIHTLLIFTFMIILLQIIPGIILNKKSKQQTEFQIN